MEELVAPVSARRPGPRLTAPAPVPLAGVRLDGAPRLPLPLRELNQVRFDPSSMPQDAIADGRHRLSSRFRRADEQRAPQRTG